MNYQSNIKPMQKTEHDEWEEGYERFVESAAEQCRCCHECTNVPCDDALAAGPCHGVCRCDDYEDMMDDWDEEEYDDDFYIDENL